MEEIWWLCCVISKQVDQDDKFLKKFDKQVVLLNSAQNMDYILIKNGHR